MIAVIFEVEPAPGQQGAHIDLGAVAVLSNPLRYAFDEAAKRATQFAAPADPDKPPVEAGEAPGLEGTDFYSPTRSTFANGMHAVVVETDPDTADVRVLRYCVVHDCGTLINPIIVEGQVHGGVAQGVGGALLGHADGLGRDANAKGMALIVASQNDGAVRLYGRTGFAPSHRRPITGFPDYKRSGDWVLMTKPRA